MRVGAYEYHSPGDITIEALSDVGRDVAEVALRYLANQQAIDDARKGIDEIIGASRLRKEDLSRLSDRAIVITAENLAGIRERVTEISGLLRLEHEFNMLREMSPNTVVAGKVVIALAKQLAELAAYQSAGLLDLNRPPEDAEPAQEVVNPVPGQ